MPRPRKPASPFRYFNSSPEIIRLAVMLYVKYPLSLSNVEDLLAERGIDVSYETVRHCGTGSGRCSPRTSAGSGSTCAACASGWHLDEVYVKVNGEMRYLWRAPSITKARSSRASPPGAGHTSVCRGLRGNEGA